MDTSDLFALVDELFEPRRGRNTPPQPRHQRTAPPPPRPPVSGGGGDERKAAQTLSRWLKTQPGHTAPSTKLGAFYAAHPEHRAAVAKIKLKPLALNYPQLLEWREGEQAVRAVPPKRECIVCAEERSRGVACGEGHFFCGVCLGDQVDSVAGEQDATLAQPDRPALVMCACCTDAPVPLPEDEVVAALSEAKREVLRAVHTRVHVHRAVLAERARAEEEARRIAAMAEDERKTYQHRKHIVDNLLTLKCPRAGCGQAFVKYEGCAALYCPRAGCGCGFCAICFKDCGRDAHDHVIAEHKGFPGLKGHYITMERAEEHWSAQKKAKVEAYLAAIADAGERERARAACAVDLAD